MRPDFAAGILCARERDGDTVVVAKITLVFIKTQRIWHRDVKLLGMGSNVLDVQISLKTSVEVNCKLD